MRNKERWRCSQYHWGKDVENASCSRFPTGFISASLKESFISLWWREEREIRKAECREQEIATSMVQSDLGCRLRSKESGEGGGTSRWEHEHERVGTDSKRERLQMMLHSRRSHSNFGFDFNFQSIKTLTIEKKNNTIKYVKIANVQILHCKVHIKKEENREKICR